MITRNDAEQIAAAVSSLRPDWPLGSIMTLIEKQLTHWTYLDLVVGMAYIAAERNPDGTPTSRTPARVKEDGPWRSIGHVDPNATAARERAARELAERRAGIAERNRAVEACAHCGPTGRLANGNLCAHDGPVDWRAQKVRALADAARAEIRPAKLPIGEKP
jgi:hypothetical protein